MIAFCGCAQNAPVSGSSEKPNNYDSLVVVTDDYLIYLSFQEYTDITLSATDPASLDFGRYRIPTKDEAAILHTRYIQAQTSQRFLCIAPDGYYSFCFSKVGNITKAGSKTKYAVRPVRVLRQPRDTIIEL